MATENASPREAAAETLGALQEAVRQRWGELAAQGTEGSALSLQLATLRQSEFVREPEPVSPRRGIGGVVVFVRRAVFHLFLKWYTRGVLQQQNEFNRVASGLLADLLERQQELRRELATLHRRLAVLESSERSLDEPRRSNE